MSALKKQIVGISDQAVLVQIFKETAQQILALAADDLEALDLIKEALEPEVNDLVSTYRMQAVESGLATYVEKRRESAPNKAKYIELHGEDAWKQNCKVTTFQQWERLKK
jgi:hypothetical protein